MSTQTLSTTCGYCSTGCNLLVTLENGKLKEKRPNPEYPVNLGKICPKGYTMLDHLGAPDRALTPYLRDKSGTLKTTDWDTALNIFVKRLKRIQEQYGKESVAFLSTGQITTEEFVLLGALAKFGMGIIHGDGNTRQCMATAAVAYKQAFGFDAPPFTYKDFEESDVLIFIGANIVIAHPIMWNRVRMNTNSPEIIVIDPRKTKIAEFATQHYAVHPQSDLTLLYGVARLLIQNDWIDRKYIETSTTGFEQFREHVQKFTIERVTEETGLNEEQVLKLAKTIAQGKRVSFWWTMGVNHSHQGVRTAQAIIDLALMTGNIGKPGTGANSITGQCNAMGSRLFSNTTSLLGGYDFKNPQDRRKVATILEIDEQLIPSEASWPYDRILKGIEEGRVKGLWVIATNPAHSWISKTTLFSVLKKLDFLVVQDMYYTTETAQLADLILPAAGCGEKRGTFINSERRLGLIREVLPPPGEAKTDFEIFKMIAQAWGCEHLFSKWSSPEAVFEIVKKLSRGQPCDITGIKNYEMIAGQGGIQWPYPEGTTDSSIGRRLFEDGRFYHEDERARFMFDDVVSAPEKTDAEYPLILLTGRGTVMQWHTQTRTGKVESLKKGYPENVYVEINLADAERMQIQDQEWVRVASRRAEVRAVAAVGETVPAGQVFMPMHYFETNKLTYPAFDPYSREPAYKMAAVKIMKEKNRSVVKS